jgi:hypothetical protein
MFAKSPFKNQPLANLNVSAVIDAPVTLADHILDNSVPVRAL